MFELASQAPHMDPVYCLGEAIDFKDAFDSRPSCDTDIRGRGRKAASPNLTFGSTQSRTSRLSCAPRYSPFLQKVMTCCACGWRAAARKLRSGALVSKNSAKLQWRKARLKRRRDASSRAELRLSFAIDAPRSPYELGLFDDRRLLGLRFAKLKVSAAEPAAPKRRTLTR